MIRAHALARILVVLSFAVGAAGCGTDHYEVTMEPVDGGVRRTLSCWRVGKDLEGRETLAPIDPDRRRALAALYGADPDAESGARAEFAATFAARLPEDLRGAGRFDVRRTSLGAAYAYTERIGGGADPDLALAEVSSSAELAAELLAATLRESPDAGRLEPLAQAIETRGREDFAAYCRACVRLGGVGATVQEGGQPFYAAAEEARASFTASFLVERGYADDLWDARALSGSDDWGYERLLARLWRFRSREEPPSALLERLARTGDPEEEAERRRAFYASARTRAVLEAWNSRRSGLGLPPIDADRVAREGDKALYERMTFASALLSLDPDDVVRVRLRTLVRPTETNGRWDEAAKETVWELQTSHESVVFASVHARWAVPDERAQTARCGRVFLTAGLLEDYAAALGRLTDDERARWEAALRKVTPGTCSRKALSELLLATAGRDPYEPLRSVLAVAYGDAVARDEEASAKSREAPSEAPPAESPRWAEGDPDVPPVPGR